MAEMVNAVLDTVYVTHPNDFMNKINQHRDINSQYKKQLNKISKNKIIVTSHALARFNSRVNTGKTWLTKKQLQEMAYYAKYKGVHISTQYHIKELLKDSPEFMEYILSHDKFWDKEDNQDFVYYNNMFWIFKGNHNRTLITVFSVGEKFIEF